MFQVGSPVMHMKFNCILTLSFIKTLSDATAADGFLKTVTKEEIAQNVNFSFCHKVIHSIMEIFYVLTKYVQSRLLQNCRMRERVNCCLNLFEDIVIKYIDGTTQMLK